MSASIALTRGLSVIVDAADLSWLQQWKWHAHHSVSATPKFYAARMGWRDNLRCRNGGRRVIIYMHRQILGLSFESDLLGDHINGDTMDCRRINLRAASPSLNVHNQPARSKSGFLGVCELRPGQFHARLKRPGRSYHIGAFGTAEEAARARDAAAIEVYGPDARLNFPLPSHKAESVSSPSDLERLARAIG